MQSRQSFSDKVGVDKVTVANTKTGFFTTDHFIGAKTLLLNTSRLPLTTDGFNKSLQAVFEPFRLQVDVYARHDIDQKTGSLFLDDNRSLTLIVNPQQAKTRNPECIDFPERGAATRQSQRGAGEQFW